MAEPRANDWLNHRARNVHSQFGEDGILEAVLEVVLQGAGPGPRWCVEFGAWDGAHLSNTRHLIADRGWSGVLIEGDPARFVDLEASYRAQRDRVRLLRRMVGFEPHDGLDAALRATEIPIEFDLLSIDIDGNDYHVLEAMRTYRPRVVIIEFNPSIPNEVEFVQPRDMAVAQGCSVRSIVRMARGKGYELVATTKCNAILVEAQLFARFGIRDNSVEALRTDLSAVTWLFQGFDGTVHLTGAQRLLWHDLPIDASRLQPLPRGLRQYPERYGGVARLFHRILRRLRR